MLAHTLWQVTNSAAAGRFRRALRNPAAAQARMLARYLRRNSSTAYGQRHHFERVRGAAEFQRRVPVTTYDDYVPSIERIAAGEGNVLTAEKVLYFAPTSGSTSAEKYIPYTRSLLREFNAGIGPWINDLFRWKPALKGGPAYWSITPATLHVPRMRSQVPIGFENDAAYLNPLAQWLAESTLAVPSAIARVSDIERFQYQTLLHLLRARELRLISVWHPSFLMLLLDALPRYWERLLSEVGDDQRAGDLRAAGPGRPAGYWPRLGLISCWAHGHAEMSAKQLGALFPGVSLQAKGLISTEAFASLPWHGGDGEAVTPLAVTSHFFEFLANDGRAILPQHADVNGDYTLLITTAGGLYRYNTHDRIRVTGRVHETPCIRFLGKEDHICDLRGEKLGAVFVGEVLRRLVGEASFAMLAPEVAATPCYTLFVETAGPVTPLLAAALDRELSANPHYAYCRRLGQLGAARVVRVRNAGALYLEACRGSGQRLGSIKPAPLHPAHHWPDVFKAHVVTD